MIPMIPTPLSAMAFVSAGQGAPKDNEFSESGTPFVRAGSLGSLLGGKSEADLELVSDEIAKQRRLKLYPKGTVLFAKSGMSATKDRVYVLRHPAYVVSHLATLVPKAGTHTDYLRFALRAFPPSKLIKDLAYPAISLGDIEDFKIPVPEESDDQIRIAHLLGKVEELIAQRKQQLQQLDDLLKSVFLEMFGDPARNEMGWEVGSLSGYGSFKNGLNFGKGESGTKVRYLGVGDFKALAKMNDIGGLSYIELNSLPGDDYFLQDGDLVFVRSNGNRELVGRCMAVYPGAERVTYSGFCIRYRINQSDLQSTYIAHLFRSTAFRRTLFQGGQGANIQNINQQVLSGLSIPLPPEGLQKKFAATVEAVDDLKGRYQQSLADLEALYGTLSQQAFKGELDLTRVPLSDAEPQEPQFAAPVAGSSADLPPAIDLPDTDLLSAVLSDVARLGELLTFWLEAYRAQLNGAAFSTQAFLTAAQTRISELHPDNDFELGVDAYDLLKSWLFEALASRRLTQDYADADNRVTLAATAVPG